MQITTVSTKGQLVIPAEMRAQLGLHAGSRVALKLDKERIILQPVTAQFVDDTAGMLSDEPSLVDELQQERRDEKW